MGFVDLQACTCHFLLQSSGGGGQHFLVWFKKQFLGLHGGCESWASILILSGDSLLKKFVEGALGPLHT